MLVCSLFSEFLHSVGYGDLDSDPPSFGFPAGISHVLGVRSGNEMAEVHTRGSVTEMPDLQSFGDPPDEQLIGGAMGVDRPTFLKTPDLAVPHAVLSTCPEPALIGVADDNVLSPSLIQRANGLARRDGVEFGSGRNTSFPPTDFPAVGLTETEFGPAQSNATVHGTKGLPAMLFEDLGGDRVAIFPSPLVMSVAQPEGTVGSIATLNRACLHAPIIPQNVGHGCVCGECDE